MEDIAPALYEAIQADFDKLVAEDRTIAAILKKIEAGTATHADTQQYAIRIGAHAATALKRNLTEGLLPDGQLYYNIAERTIRPALEHNLELVNAVASQVQAALNEAAGIGIKPISATLDDDRIHRIVSSAADTPTITAMHGWLGEAVINTTQSFADEFIRANAEFHYQSGLSPKIVRTSTGKCCDWCEERAGTYDYGDAQERDVFRRHKHCRCLVVYDPGTGRYQNVHSKKWSNTPTADVIEQRRLIGLSTDSIDAFRPGDYDATISKHVSVDRSSLLARAKAGERHAHGGVYIDATKKTKKQLQKSIVSRVSQVERHADKIQHPEDYDVGWKDKSPREQQGLIAKWEKDMRRNAEQAEIELAVFEERF